MKKNTKVALSGEKKLQKKKELERISNKQLIIFTVGLIAEVILLFFYSALKSSAYNGACKVLEWGSLAFFVIFIALLIIAAVKKKKGAEEKKVKSIRNWGFCSLAFAFGSLFVVSGKLISDKGLDKPDSLFFRYFTGGTYLNPQAGNSVITAMILVAAYVLIALICLSIKAAKVKKSR